MPVKPRLNASLEEKANERLDKLVGRAYVIWLLGVFVGALNLKPGKVDYSGLSFEIDSPQKLQGIIYFGCLLYYVGMLAVALLFHLQNTSANYTLKRRIIYGCLGKKRTLVGYDVKYRATLRATIRLVYSLAILFLFITTFFPVFHILFFQQTILLTGIDAIFKSISFQNEKVNLLAPSVLLLQLFIMLGWTGLLWTLFRPRLGNDIFFFNMFAAFTFGYLDSWFRTHEAFSEATLRAIGLQTTIYLLWRFPQILLVPFTAWLSLKVLYYRIKYRQKKK